MFRGVIPTDSLYKFLAMFGLAIVITSLLSAALLDPEVEELLDLLPVLEQSGELEAFTQVLAMKTTVLVSRAAVVSISLFVGLVISGVGFWMWYRRKQMYEDLLLVAEFRRQTRESATDSLELPLRYIELHKRMGDLDKEDSALLEEFAEAINKELVC